MEIVFASGLRDRVRAALLAAAPREAGGAIFARIHESSPAPRVLAFDFELPRTNEIFATHDQLNIAPAFWARVSKRARRLGASVVPIHTHPFDPKLPRFSRADDIGEQTLLPAIVKLTGRATATIVVSPAGEQLGTWQDGRRRYGSVRELGRTPAMAAEEDLSLMYSRQALAFGPLAQAHLRSTTAAVVGASGTGSIVCEELIRLGVGRIITIDPKAAALQNLTRVTTMFRADADATRPKVDCVVNYAKSVGSGTEVIPLSASIEEEHAIRLVRSADVIFGCTDTLVSRAILNRIAVQDFIPYWDCGTEIPAGDGPFRAFARLRQVVAGSGCLVCMGAIDPEQLRIELLTPAERDLAVERGYIDDPRVIAPAVISVNAVAASLAVTSYLRYLAATEPIASRQWTYRAREGDVREQVVAMNPSCPVCDIESRLARCEDRVSLRAS